MKRIEVNVVTGEAVEIELTAEEIAAAQANAERVLASNVAIDSQIDALERKKQLPRITRDMHRMVTLQAAAAQGITEADLLSEGNPHYSAGYARFYAFDAEIASLRAQRV